jgi:hypothetical protein
MIFKDDGETEFPLTFELITPRDIKTYCGVRMFTAPTGKAMLPCSVMKSLALEEGTRVRFRLVCRGREREGGGRAVKEMEGGGGEEEGGRRVVLLWSKDVHCPDRKGNVALFGHEEPHSGGGTRVRFRLVCGGRGRRRERSEGEGGGRKEKEEGGGRRGVRMFTAPTGKAMLPCSVMKSLTLEEGTRVRFRLVCRRREREGGGQ